MSRFVIGIDPGKNTGFAVYDRHTRQLQILETLDFWKVYGRMRSFRLEDVPLIVVEVPETKHIWHTPPDNVKALQRQAVTVGGVIREAVLLADGIEGLGFTVKRKHPLGKCTHAKFAALTGWNKRTDEHQRDAGRLAWGR